MLAEKLYTEGAAFAQGWNFGPRDDDVQLVERFLIIHGPRAGVVAPAGSSTPHLSRTKLNLLKLDISKACAKLKWHLRWPLAHALESIIDRC